MPEARNSADKRLRGYLHGWLADFVQGYVNRAEADGDTELATYTEKAYRARLDALLEGREVRHISRSDLPSWHPESTAYGGSPYDEFTLGPEPGDELIPVKSTPSAFVPNRAERRAAGWRGNGLNGNGSG